MLPINLRPARSVGRRLIQSTSGCWANNLFGRRLEAVGRTFAPIYVPVWTADDADVDADRQKTQSTSTSTSSGKDRPEATRSNNKVEKMRVNEY